ncbi:MAG: radical SAM protein [Candidatus Omnitrophota bacterium]
MKSKGFKYLYGPVSSWRLGISLGIDLLSSPGKICNFDCVYCQLGPAASSLGGLREYVKTTEITKELRLFFGGNGKRQAIDYITFSGSGESTLAKNLGQAIKAVKKLKFAPVAVLTNGALINRGDIRRNLSFSDFAIVKLDAYSQESLEKINCPAGTIRFENILKGLKKFKKEFKGKFALQMMFIDDNLGGVDKLVKIAGAINPDQVQINTPTRLSNVRRLSKNQVFGIKKHFCALNPLCVYDARIKRVAAFNKSDTHRRRGQEIAHSVERRGNREY